MTTKRARSFGFDVSTVPDGIERVGSDMMARVSLVFRPNGKGNLLKLLEIVNPDTLANALGADWGGLSSDQLDVLINRMIDDPNDFNLPRGVRRPFNNGIPEQLGESEEKDRSPIWTKGTGGIPSIADNMIENLVGWLKLLPKHLYIAAEHTSLHAQTSTPTQPDSDTPEPGSPSCHVSVGIGEYIDICTLIPPEFRPKFPDDVPFNKSMLSGFVDPVEIITGRGLKPSVPLSDWALPQLPDLDDIVELQPNGEAWPLEQIKAFWEAMFTEDELRDLARALLFPDDPLGERSTQQKLARDSARATLSTDAAGALAAGMAEIKVQELLASVENTFSENERSGVPFADGLATEDMIGTIFGKLLGTVQVFQTDQSVPAGAPAAEEAEEEAEAKARRLALKFDLDADALTERTLTPELLGLKPEDEQPEDPENTPVEEPKLPARRSALEIAQIAEARRRATIRSMLYETFETAESLGYPRDKLEADDDGLTDFIEQKIGDLRPGFGKLLFEIQRRDLTAQAALEADETARWQTAFSGGSAEPLVTDVRLELPNEINASKAVELAFAEIAGLAVEDSAQLLREELSSVGDTTTYRDFVEVLATSKLAWRKSSGVVEETRDSDGPQRALKRFQELYAHPVLARGLGLVRDYYVKLDQLSPHEKDGFLRIGARAMHKHPHTQTAVFVDSTKAGALAFRPAGREEWSTKAADPNGGLPNLAKKRNDGLTRYQLQSLDEQQLLRATEQAAKSAADTFLEGLDPSSIDTSLPAMRVYGISLLDRGRLEEETSRKAAAQVARTWPGDSPLLAFSENLTIGLRIDIGIEQGSNNVWFNTGARDITYANRSEAEAYLPQTYSTATAGMEEMKHRTSSFVTPINRYVDHPDAVDPQDRRKSALPGETANIVAQQTLVTWFGRSFLQRRAPEQEFLLEDFFAPMRDPSDCPLPLFLDYFEPKSPGAVPASGGVASGVAPLIERVGYFVGARPVYINRGGPTLDEVWRSYDGLNGQAPLRLGRYGSGTAFQFGRNEPIAAPEVLITDQKDGPAKEPLFYSHDPTARRTEDASGETPVITQWPGNSSSHLILRSNTQDGQQISTDEIEIVQRFIVPPRVDITTAEFAGVLMGASPKPDDDGTNIPHGMFHGDDVHQVSWTGGFPMAEGGGEPKEPEQPSIDNIDPDPLNLGADANQLDRPSKSYRGSVFRGKRSPDPQYPWYPDPLANVLCVMPVRDGVPLLSEPVRVQVLVGDSPWPNLRPALIQLMRKGARAPDGTTYSVATYTGNGLELRTGTTEIDFLQHRVPTIGIWLEDGRSCELFTWFAPVGGEEIASHNLVQYLRQSQSLGIERFTASNSLFDTKDVKAIEGPLVEALRTVPLRGLVNITRLSLQSAVQKPLRAPDLGSEAEEASIGFARLDLAEDIAQILKDQPATTPKQAAIEALQTWIEGVTPADLIGPNGGAHTAGATSIGFTGRVWVDRPSTAELRIEARWTDWTDDITRPAQRHEPPKDSDAQHEHFLRPFKPRAPEGWTLLEGTRTPVANSDALFETQVDLLLDEDGLPRCLIHDFLDTRAREIELRLVATSRDANRFTETDDPDRFVLRGTQTKISVPASARPPQPVLAEEMLPIFHEERSSSSSSGFDGKRRSGVRIERATSLRYFLKRPWFEAGGGQKLAVLLWDGALFDPQAVSKVDAAATTPNSIPPSMRPYVSLHGRDPKFTSASLPDFLTGADFINDVDRVAGLELPDVAVPTGEVATDYKVSAALFEPYLDRTRDIWLADIKMAARNSYMPFVRLSLAAYQRNALSGLELSRPVEGWGRIPPRRDCSITVGYNSDQSLDGRVRIAVDGGTYTQREPGPMLTNHAAQTNRPWLEVIFLERAAGHEGSGGWVKVAIKENDSSGFVNPRIHQTGTAAASDSDKLWDFQTALPNAWRDKQLPRERAILVREYERIASDAGGPLEQHVAIANSNVIEIVEGFETSVDGLSSVIRGRTTFAAIVTLDELLGKLA